MFYRLLNYLKNLSSLSWPCFNSTSLPPSPRAARVLISSKNIGIFLSLWIHFLDSLDRSHRYDLVLRTLEKSLAFFLLHFHTRSYFHIYWLFLLFVLGSRSPLNRNVFRDDDLNKKIFLFSLFSFDFAINKEFENNRLPTKRYFFSFFRRWKNRGRSSTKMYRRTIWILMNR